MNMSIRNLQRKKFYKVLIISLLIIIIGYVYQCIMVHYETEKYKIPGQLIKIYNDKMHIYSEGDGTPTLVFTVGSGTPSAYTDYYFIQKSI
ncbi:MAG: hypothetical protein FH753_16055 [Firmicutes bacterium]|nr:hypothetical protein [Bacillota bacterium]